MTTATQPGGVVSAAQARRYATRISLIASLGAFFLGFEAMVFNGAVRAVGEAFQLGPIEKGIAGVAGIIGGLIGAFIAGRISDKVGRRTVLIAIGPFLLCEAIFGAFSPALGGYWMLLLARALGGFGFGAATTVGPGYIAEIAPPEIRGRLIAFRQLEIILGLFISGMINMFLISKVPTGAEFALGLKVWQWIFLALLIPAVFYIVMTITIPESPRYLVTMGRDEEAKAVLSRVAHDGDPQGRIDAIRRTLDASTKTLSIPKILRSKWRGLVFIGVMIAAFQQLTGINGIFFYSNALFESVGFNESTAFLQTMIITFFKIVGVCTGIMLVDRVGRRAMLIAGGSLMTVSLAVLALVFTFAPAGEKGGPDLSANKILGIVAIGALCTFILGFTSSWGPIFSIVMGEMFPNNIRGGAMSLASSADFLVSFFIVLLYPFAIKWSPAGTYWIYCFFGVCSVLFTIKYLKETKGRQLEDMG